MEQEKIDVPVFPEEWNKEPGIALPDIKTGPRLNSCVKNKRDTHTIDYPEEYVQQSIGEDSRLFGREGRMRAPPRLVKSEHFLNQMIHLGIFGPGKTQGFHVCYGSFE